jgi:hypothetical protein
MKEISDEEYENHFLYDSFINSQRFDYIREKIDEKFELLINKWKEQSSKESIQVLDANKMGMRDVLYNMAFYRFVNNDYLTKTLEIVTNAIKKKESKKSSGIVQEIIIKSGENILMPIVVEMFVIPNLVLATLEKNFNNFTVMLKEAEESNNVVNNELAAAHNLLKKNKTKVKISTHKEIPIDLSLKYFPDLKNEIKREAENCRMRNGKISYSKLGRIFSISHHTAMNWCKKIGVQNQILNLH